jgi:hypothetical protein
MNSVPSNLSGGNNKGRDGSETRLKPVDMSVYFAEALAQHFEIMGAIADSLDTIALYFERKGESENVWHPDDLTDGDDESDDDDDEPKVPGVEDVTGPGAA